MTGMYLLVGANGEAPVEDYMQHLHRAIAGELLQLGSDRTADPEVRSAAELAMEYIEQFASDVYIAVVNQHKQPNA